MIQISHLVITIKNFISDESSFLFVRFKTYLGDYHRENGESKSGYAGNNNLVELTGQFWECVKRFPSLLRERKREARQVISHQIPGVRGASFFHFFFSFNFPLYSLSKSLNCCTTMNTKYYSHFLHSTDKIIDFCRIYHLRC